MARVELDGVSKRYGAGHAVDTVSMTVPSGQFLTLLGPSGCGKSTTLRMVAGLAAPTAGRVLIDGRDVTQLGAAARGIGMVFQSLALFPHMTIAQNVAFGLRMRKLAAPEIARRVQAMLAIVRLDALSQRYPNELSGGQQQRVALARALVIEPALLILDEPFGALDRKLREAMQVELRQITRELRTTALFVTHDQEEALMLSDLVAVMNQGRIEQLGTPQEVFAAPRTRFVADFMGVTNLLTASWCAGRLQIADAAAPPIAISPAADGGTLELAIRPEEIALLPPGQSDALPAAVTHSLYHGTSTSYTLRLLDGQTLVARERNDAANPAPRFAAGDRVGCHWPPAAVHVLSDPPKREATP